MVVPDTQGAQAWTTQFYLQLHQCLPLSRKRSPNGASQDWGCVHLIAAYSFIYPKRMTGWVGLVGWPTSLVTRQLQVDCKTGKVCRSKTHVLPTVPHNQCHLCCLMNVECYVVYSQPSPCQSVVSWAFLVFLSHAHICGVYAMLINDGCTIGMHSNVEQCKAFLECLLTVQLNNCSWYVHSDVLCWSAAKAARPWMTSSRAQWDCLPMLVAWRTSRDDGFTPTPAVNSSIGLSPQHYPAMETTVLPVRLFFFVF